MKPAGKGQDAFWERVASRVADHRVVVIVALTARRFVENNG